MCTYMPVIPNLLSPYSDIRILQLLDINYYIFIGQLKMPRKFNDSYFNLGEPNLILVPSSKINLCRYNF